MDIEKSKRERALARVGYKLGAPPPPAGQYVGAVRAGNLVFTAGHGPVDDAGELAMRGQVGGTLTVEEGREAGRLSILSCLASLKAEIGDLDRVRRVVKLLAFVNCAPGFNDTPQVVDGASELLGVTFGKRGVHARAAIGTSVLPGDMPVEIEMVVEVE